MADRVIAAMTWASIGKVAAVGVVLGIIIAGIWLWNNKGDDPFP
jgi:hypothetical protein